MPMSPKVLLCSAAAAAAALLTSPASATYDVEKEQMPSQRQYEHDQPSATQAAQPRLLRKVRRTSGIGSGEVPTKYMHSAQGDDLHASQAVLQKPRHQRHRSLYEYDGKLKLKWGKDGQHAPDSHIDITEKEHRDIPKDRDSDMKPYVNKDRGNNNIDPILYYCTHAYACRSLTAQIAALTTQMESLPSYEAMLVECQGVAAATSSQTQVEFCNDARTSYQSEAEGMLQEKEATEAAADVVCTHVTELEEEAPFKITDNVCDGSVEGGSIVPDVCVDTMRICSDGTVACQGGSMPHESCPAEDDCDRYCSSRQIESPCVCIEGNGDAREKQSVDGTKNDQIVDVVPADENGQNEGEEEDAAEVLIDAAEEELDEAEVVLEAIEEEQRVAAEIEELRAKIAQLEAF